MLTLWFSLAVLVGFFSVLQINDDTNQVTVVHAAILFFVLFVLSNVFFGSTNSEDELMNANVATDF